MTKKDLETSTEIAKSITRHILGLKEGILEMREEREKAENSKNSREEAIAFCDHVKGMFEQIREHVDELELLVDDTLWPLPKYREILFAR